MSLPLEKIIEAINYATKAHNGQVRKSSNLPYINHPIEVGSILIQYQCSTNVIVAGILHDTLEDTPVTFTDLKQKFGREIANLVKINSEPNKLVPWEERKQHTLDHLKTMPLDALYIAFADKYDNLRSSYQDFQQNGDHTWDKFNRGKESQKWYYQSLAKIFKRRLRKHTLVQEFDELVKKIFN